MAVKTNVREGVVLDLSGGELTGTQTVDVQGLDGVGLDQLYRALLHGSVPREGAAAPGVPDMKVVSLRAAPNGVSGARVTVRYGKPAADASAEAVGRATVRISTETISEDTVYDIDGNLMETSYTAAAASGVGGSTTSTIRQFHRVSVQRPTFGVAFTRVERENAFRTAVQYAGKVNDATWQGLPEKTWLMRVNSDQVEEDLHRVTYTAVYNPSTWRVEIQHTAGGRIPPLASADNGISFRDVYPSIDYSRLGLREVL